MTAYPYPSPPAVCSTCRTVAPVAEAEWRLGEPYCTPCAAEWDADHTPPSRARRAAEAIVGRFAGLGVVPRADLVDAAEAVLGEILP